MMEKDAATTLRARQERRDEQAEYPSTHDTATAPSLRGHAASRRRDEAMTGRMPSPSGPRTNGLYIDVNAPAQPVSPVALASPLAIFSTKKLPANAYRSHPVAELANDRRLLTKLNGSPFLEYGMVVSIVCDDRDGILSAEGFASREARLEMINYEASSLGAKLGLGGREERKMFEERGVRLIDGSFRDCLFEVVPRMTYDATMALNEVLSENASGKQTPSHSGIAVSSVADLKFKSDAEMRLNAMTYRKLKGTQVLYGHTIQLRHVKSRQFLSLDTMPLSFRGAEYAKVSLDTDSPRCHFVILPRFKLRAMGAPVQLTDQVILTGGDDLQPFNLFASNRATSNGSSFAVVGSGNHTSHWRAILYDRQNEIDEDASSRSQREGIRAGSCVRLLHLESNSWLQCVPREYDGSAPVTLSFSEDSDGVDSSVSLSSDSLWEIERASTFEGGAVNWSCAITLRHVLSGKYLAVVAAQSTPTHARSPSAFLSAAKNVDHVVVFDRPHPFRFISTAMTDEDDQIEKSAIALLQHQASKTFLHSPETHASSMTDIRISSKALSQGNRASSTFSVIALPGARDEDAFKVVAVSSAERDDTLFLLSYKRSLSQYISQLSFSSTIGTRSDAQNNSHFDRDEMLALCIQVERAIRDLTQFCGDSGKTSKLLIRQDMLRTHGYIEVLMDVVKAPFCRFGGPFTIEEVSSFNSSFTRLSKMLDDPDEELPSPHQPSSSATESLVSAISSPYLDGSVRITSRNAVEPVSSPGVRELIMQSITRIIPAVNALLVRVFSGNRESELQMVQLGMPVLMELLGNGFQTSLPLSYLLRESRNLVESITDYGSIIRNFFELIKSRGRSIRYMQFLVALCTSRGRGVPKMQEAICELLFNSANGFRDSVIVPLRPSDDGFQVFVRFPRSSKNTVSSTPNDGSWMELSSFYRNYYLFGTYRGMGQYCYGLLQLYVALCLDRNYVSIEYVQKTFPRENLLQAVKDEALARSIRAVLLNLLRVAYVDCEPQKSIACPAYTRIWSDIETPDRVRLCSISASSHTTQDQLFFVEIKDFCFNYINSIRGKVVIEEAPQNQLTLSVTQICKKMVEFGMYSSQPELSRLVVGLVDLLDERTDVESQLDLGRNSTKLGVQVDSRQREDSVTEGTNKLFTTMLAGVPEGSEDGQIPHVDVYDSVRRSDECGATSDAVTMRYRNSTLLDGAFSTYNGKGDKMRNIARQYGVESSIWTQLHASLPSYPSRRSIIPNHSGQRESRQSTSGPSIRTKQHDLVTTHVSTERYQMTDVNRVVMEMKDEICATLQLVDNIRLDYQISILLATFRNRHASLDFGIESFIEEISSSECDQVGVKIIPTEIKTVLGASEKASLLAKLMFGKKALECDFSLSQLSQRNISTVLMQMLMYEYPPLVSKALELILQQFNQHDQLLKAVHRVQVLVSEETIMIYNRLKDDVDTLRRLSETTEVWMDLTSKSDYEKAECASFLLRSIRGVLIKQPSRRSLLIDSSTRFHSAHGRDRSVLHSEPGDALVGKNHDHTYAPRLAIEKSPPNRKLRSAQQCYALKYSLGLVSQFSSCHEILPMATLQYSASRQRRSRTLSGGSPGSEAKRLLRNLNAAQYVVNMLQDGAHFYDAHLSLQPDGIFSQVPGTDDIEIQTMMRNRQHQQIRAVFADAMEFLCSFCEADQENQALLSSHVKMIATYIGELDAAQKLLVSIYALNPSLYKTAPAELINAFVAQLVRDPINPRYLYFLETLVLCDEVPVRDNQLLVLFQLIKSLENGAILQLFDDLETTCSRFSDLFDRFEYFSGRNYPDPEEPLPDNEDATGVGMDRASSSTRFKEGATHEPRYDAKVFAHDSQSLEYHTRLLHLLAACATGKNTKCQEICQQMVSLPVALDLLSLPKCSDGMKFALTRFLNQVYVVADDTEAPHEDLLLQILHVLSNLFVSSVLKYLRQLHDEDVNQSVRMSLHKMQVKKIQHKLSPARTPTESKPLYLLLHSLVPALVSFIHQFPMVFEWARSSDSIVNLFYSLSCLLYVSCTGEWNLHDEVMASIEEVVYLLDKEVSSNIIQDGAPVTLSRLWLDSFTRCSRPNLTNLQIRTALPNLLEALLCLGDPSSLSDSRLAEKDSSQPVATVTTTSTDKFVCEPDTQKPSGLFTGPSGLVHPLAISKTNIQDGRTGGSPSKGLPISLHVVQPIFSGVSAHNEEKQHRKEVLASDSSNPSNGLKTGLFTNQSPQKKKGKGATNLYSRQSTFSVQWNNGLTTMNSNMRRSSHRQRARNRQLSSGMHRHHFEAFDRFLWMISMDSRTEWAMREELNRMVESILSVEATLQEEFNPDSHFSYVRLTFDQVVSRLVAHVEALHDSSYVKTNVILLDVFCRMINAVDDWERKHQMQIKLNKLGVTKLVVQLIATRDDDAIFERSIELGVALLDGMNAEVQESFFRYWMQELGPSFCAQLERRIRTACKHIRSGHKEGVLTSKLLTQDGRHTSSIHEKYLMPEEKRQLAMRDDKDASVNNRITMPSDGDRLRISGGPTTNLFRFLQLLCEGHYLAAQRYFIAQPNAKSSVNLVETTTSFLLETYLALADLDISLVIQLFETITELCQGPCIEAQETVANFKFISSVNALMMHSFSQASRSELFLVRRLRASIVVTLLSLLEGRSDQVIHAHLVQELNFEALQRNLVESYTHFLMEYEGKYAGNTKCSDDFYLDMGFNIYFLLQQLADCFPSSATWLPRQRAEKYEWSCSSASKHSPSDSLLFVALSNGLTPEYHEAFHFFQSHSACVEIVWNHQRNPADKRSAANARAPSGTQKRGNEDGEGDATDSSYQGDVISYYFPLHPVCFCLTEQSKKKLVWNVSRGGNKLQDFYNRSDKLVDEMAHQSRLQQHPILAACSRRSDLLKRLSFALAVGINLTVLLFYQADGIDSSPYPATRVTFVVSTDDVVSAPSKTIDIALSSAGTVQLVLCCLILVCYLINSAPLLIKKGWKRHIQAAAELQSKKSASAHRLVHNVEDKETFQDTEQLLRSLRDREEEYDFMFLPRRNPKNRQSLATPHQDMMSNVVSSRPTNLWERISHSLFGPKRLLPSNHYHTSERPSVATTSDVATTIEYIRTVSISMYFLLRSPRVIYYEWMIFIAVLGSYVNKLFFAFHLLDVVTRFQELSNVLRAIARPAKVLGATVLLYLVIVYVFSTIGFFFFREDYNPTQTLTPAQRAGRDSYQCQRLFQCFLISLDQGFKSDGGLGGYLKQRSIGETSETYGRLAFDLLYNTILLIMLLNIVFGVIIDTFALLRTADNEKLMDMQSRCFICSIDAYTFDRMTRRGFHDHIYMDHNMWHYLYLFVHIRKKLITEYNGLELYLAMRMAKKDVSFFPSHRALCLEKATDDTIINHAEKPSGSMFDGEPSSFHPRHNGANMHERSAHTERPFSPQSSLYPSGVNAPSQSTQRGRRRSSLTGSGEGAAESLLNSKLEKLEATIESLLVTQSELKDHQARAAERHAELIQMILSMRGHHVEVDSAATPIGMAASRSTITMTTLPSPTRIFPGDARPSPAPESVRSASATSTARRRHSSSPRVFKFDSIGEDT